jgi:hypothetical protein
MMRHPWSAMKVARARSEVVVDDDVDVRLLFCGGFSRRRRREWSGVIHFGWGWPGCPGWGEVSLVWVAFDAFRFIHVVIAQLLYSGSFLTSTSTTNALRCPSCVYLCAPLALCKHHAATWHGGTPLPGPSPALDLRPHLRLRLARHQSRQWRATRGSPADC